MKSIIYGIALFVATGAFANNTSFSVKLGQYYFSGIGSNGFLGAGEQKLPSGLRGTNVSLEYRMDHNLVEAGLIGKEHKNDDLTWFVGTSFFVKDGGNSPYLKATFVKKWIHEQNWDWNDEGNFDYINERNRSLVAVNVGYRFDCDFVMFDTDIGFAKGLSSFRLPNPMPEVSLNMVIPIFRNHDSKMEDFE